MDRFLVRSSSIRSVGYDATAAVLEIEFRLGTLYQFTAVPPSVYDRLMTAPSKGKFFFLHIKGRFRSRRVR